MARQHLLVAALLSGALTPCAAAQEISDTIPVPPQIQAAYDAGTRSNSGAPGKRYWQLWPHYVLDAALDPAMATLSGRGTLRLVNTSPTVLTEIVLRLDQNRFRGDAGRDHSTRGIDVHSLVLNGVVVDLAGQGVSGLGTTVARVRLSSPLQPGGELTATFEWEYEVPSATDRDALRQGHTGHHTFQIAQWYPRLAMYDDLAGWDVTAHDGSREFFNPFGSYRVTMRVPSGWLVGATGTLENPDSVLSKTERERLLVAGGVDTTLAVVTSGEALHRIVPVSALWRFRADSVNDFAWGTAPDFSWSVTSRTLGRQRVLVHTLGTPARTGKLMEAGRAAADALVWLSGRLMPYAWPSHTLLDGPEGGMEYPALTMSHGDLIRHELSHQWFPMMVGSDETRFDFLDEGFATYFAGRLPGATQSTTMTEPPVPEPLLHPTDLRTPRFVLGYGRGSRMLQALSDRVGESRLLAAMKVYSANWRFRHPSPWDFMASMETSLEESLDSFWLRWLFSTEGFARVR